MKYLSFAHETAGCEFFVSDFFFSCHVMGLYLHYLLLDLQKLSFQIVSLLNL